MKRYGTKMLNSAFSGCGSSCAPRATPACVFERRFVPCFPPRLAPPSSSSPSALSLRFHLQFDINQLMTSVNVSQSLSPTHKPLESPGSAGSGSHSGSGGSTGGGSVGGASGVGVEQSPVDRTKGFFPDESEPLLRCDSTSSKDSALSRNGSFITKGERVSRITHRGRSLKAPPLLCWYRTVVTPGLNEYFIY